MSVLLPYNRRMKRTRDAMACLLAVAVQSGCTVPEEPPVRDDTLRPARLHTVTATSSTRRHQFVGRVIARQTIDLAFEVGGPLAELPVREGQDVPRGALLAALEPTDFQLALREAEAQQRIARQDYERKRSLLDQRGISRSQVDDAKALLDLRDVQAEQARQAMRDSRLQAPFDARVARRYVDNHVRITPGTPVLRLHDLSELQVEANVPAHLVATATPERLLSATARFDFAPDTAFPLRIGENRGDASAVAQTYRVTFVMAPVARWNLLPGMTATITVDLLAADGAEHVIRVPAAAVVAGAEEQYFVWRYDSSSGAVERTLIELGGIDDGGVLVTGGIREGDRIVTAGAGQLRAGMRVTPLEDTAY